MSQSQIFLFICLSFIGGIFLNSFLSPSLYIIMAGLIFGLIFISVLFKYKKLVVIGFCFLFLVLGIWRHQQVELTIMNNELRKYNDLEQEITLVGLVSAEPDIRDTHTKLTIGNIRLGEEDKSSSSPTESRLRDEGKEESEALFALAAARVIKDENGSRSVDGKTLVTAEKYPEYQYGDKLKIIGKLESPPVFEDFNYQQYLQKEGIFSVMSWPKIELVGENFGNPLMKFLFSFKKKFQETAQKFISPPQIGILEALFSGDEGNISKEWKEKLNFTGTRHIAAVSGMNITIISALLLTIFLSLGFWRNRAFYLSLILLVIYILMIGAPASAVRAGIMGIIFLTAQHFGRLPAASRAVIFAATIMLALNPLLLKLDVGFQLSFLAIMGIIYLQPAFVNFFKKIPDPKFFPLRITFSTTLSAQIFTLPILIYNFGYIPLISPITNILIVPFLAPITILIFVFGLSAMLFWPLGFLFSLPIWFFLTYIVYLIDWFSKLPFASLTTENIHWIWLAISYLILGLITWRLQGRQKLKFLNY